MRKESVFKESKMLNEEKMESKNKKHTGFFSRKEI